NMCTFGARLLDPSFLSTVYLEKPPQASALQRFSPSPFLSVHCLRLTVHQLCIQFDINSRQRLRHGTILLRCLCVLEKSLFIDPRHFAFSVEFNRRDLESFANLLDTDVCIRADASRILAALP